MMSLLFSEISTIEKAQDTAFLSVLFEKISLLLKTIGLNNNYGYNDFKFKPNKKINIDKQRFVIHFPDGIIFINYKQNFSVAIGITDNSYVDCSKLNWSIHSRNCLIDVVVDNDLEYNSMTINDRFNFRVASTNAFDDFVSTFDVEYYYDKRLNVIKKFKFREMERSDDINFVFDLTLSPMFYMNDTQFDNHFFSFMYAFEKNNMLLKELFPFVPDFSTILHNHSAFNTMCIIFAEKYADKNSHFHNNILVFEMSNVI